MPSAPPVISPPAAAAGTPAAPPSGAISHTARNIGAVVAARTTPSAPAQILLAPEIHAPGLYVLGELVPDIAGEWQDADEIAAAYPGSQAWSYDGTGTPAESGAWGVLYCAFLATPASATLVEIAPHAGYTAAAEQSAAPEIQVFSLAGGWKIYWLFNGSPGTGDGITRWVDAADSGMASQDATVIQAGKYLIPARIPGGGTMTGGLGEAWQTTSPVWVWYLIGYEDGASVGYWHGSGATPFGCAWTEHLGASGEPMTSNTQIFPPAITPA